MISTHPRTAVSNEPMSEANSDRVLRIVSGGGRGVYEEEWDYDCGVLGCDKGDDDSQWRYLEGE